MAHKALRPITFTTIGITALLAACSSSSKHDQKAGEEDPIDVATSTQLLTRATSCEDLLARIKGDAIAQLDVVAEQSVAEMQGRGVPGGGLLFGGGPAMDMATSGSGGASGGDPMPTSGGIGFGGEGDAAGPAGFSDTNVQVQGVDEADIVKTDGERIYLLHGSELFVMRSFPAAETAVLGSTIVQGEPNEMFVSDGKAVVFTTLWDAPGLYDPSGSSIREEYYYYGHPFTKITVLDVGGDTPSVLRELFVEGNYVSARRHDATVRTILSDGFKVPELYPDIDYQDPWGVPYSDSELESQLEAWKARMTTAIENSSLDRWLPLTRERVDGEIRAIAPRCEDYYVPFSGMVQPGVTSIVSFNLADLGEDLGGATILGDAHEVYANKSALVLAQDDMRWMTGEDGRQQTALHRFDISGAETRYQGSGLVPGYIHNQFSIDERDGVIRIATTERIFETITEDGFSWMDQVNLLNQVTTLGVQEGELVELGNTGTFGDGEEVYSARFVGDRGYVVTFMQTDPLFVIDLADPNDPTVLGHLEIPGFSDYMHPLDADHLLTIGRETEVTPEGWVQDIGLQLQIFDVSDPLAPTRVHQHVYTDPGYSEANVSHKAFTYYADKKLLAFPFMNWGMPFRSSLEVFRVDVGTGFEFVGSADHTGMLTNQCFEPGYDPCIEEGFCEPMFCGPEPEVRRGIFIDDYVYSISYGGVLVHGLDDFVTPVATVSLPMPSYDYGYYEGGSDGVAVGGGAPAVGGTTAPTPAPPVESDAPPPADPPMADAGGSL